MSLLFIVLVPPRRERSGWGGFPHLPVSFLELGGMGVRIMTNWQAGEVRTLPLEAFGERYHRYRLSDSEAEVAMTGSLERYGQMAPIVVCIRQERPEVLDGFKRLAAVRALPQLKQLSARLLEVDERAAKAAIYGLNHASRTPRELEEAWIVFALVREDGLTQPEVADLLGRHKSWVCRRLALVERLAEVAREDLRLGLLTPTAARALVQLPAGNQVEVLAAVHRDGLTTTEVRGVVDLLRSAAGRSAAEYVLARPREALAQARGGGGRVHDARLSVAGNRVGRQLEQLLEQLARMEGWLRQRGRADLTTVDRSLLAERFTKLGCDAASIAALATDLSAELQLP
jgi:ParB-like chromosome segregation protein Spo0J